MIDIQPYLHKLDKLKEYMDAKIDGKDRTIWINFDAISDFTPQEIMDIWKSTGWLISSTKITKDEDLPRTLTFEEWYESQNKN